MQQRNAAETIDNYGKLCKICRQGIYTETRQTDDYDGVLHCNVCNAEVRRYVCPEEVGSVLEKARQLKKLREERTEAICRKTGKGREFIAEILEEFNGINGIEHKFQSLYANDKRQILSCYCVPGIGDELVFYCRHDGHDARYNDFNNFKGAIAAIMANYI